MTGFLDKQHEPVRRWLYGVAVALVAVLVGYGVVDGEQAALIGAAVTAVLAVPTTEAVRKRVTPVAKARSVTPASTQRDPAPGVYGPDQGDDGGWVAVRVLVVLGVVSAVAWGGLLALILART